MHAAYMSNDSIWCGNVESCRHVSTLACMHVCFLTCKMYGCLDLLMSRRGLHTCVSIDGPKHQTRMYSGQCHTLLTPMFSSQVGYTSCTQRINEFTLTMRTRELAATDYKFVCFAAMRSCGNRSQSNSILTPLHGYIGHGVQKLASWQTKMH